MLLFHLVLVDGLFIFTLGSVTVRAEGMSTLWGHICGTAVTRSKTQPTVVYTSWLLACSLLICASLTRLGLPLLS